MFFVVFVRYVDVFLFFHFFCCFLVFFCYLCLCFVFFPFFSSRRLFVSILSLQTAFLTFKNDGFTMEILTFLKNQSFVLENWFGCFLALFLAHFGVLYGVSGALRSIKLGLQIRAFLS